jgi:hypothetical protein
VAASRLLPTTGLARARRLGAQGSRRALFHPPGFLDEAFDTGVILYALLALAAGFVLPKGFYLWGVAVVLTPRQRSPAPVSRHGIGCGYFRSLQTQRKAPARSTHLGE